MAPLRVIVGDMAIMMPVLFMFALAGCRMVRNMGRKEGEMGKYRALLAGDSPLRVVLSKWYCYLDGLCDSYRR